MPLSANTLIHFTKNKENLKGILSDNFKVFNCREDVSLTGVVATYHVPMVSFCDIPLSEIKEHISKYGTYGLGMTKEWGMRNGLNPVLYIAPNSTLSESYRCALTHFYAKKDAKVDGQEEALKALLDIARYLKNYEGSLTRLSEVIPNYRFSDEREWRFVPPYSEKCDMLLVDKEITPESKKISDEKLQNLRLNFEPNDIKYIIINDDSEIKEFIDLLRDVKGRQYSMHDIERLTTRILTTEQIKEDI